MNSLGMFLTLGVFAAMRNVVANNGVQFAVTRGRGDVGGDQFGRPKESMPRFPASH